MFEFREVAAPYPGLRPFQPHESEIFFGREGHADRLLERRHARNLLAGYVELMGGSAEQEYVGAGAQLSGGVAVSPDGKLLAAAGERATLVLFDSASGKLLRRLEGPEWHDPKTSSSGDVRSVVFDPEGRWLFSGGDDRRIIRWSLPTGEKLGEWKAPGGMDVASGVTKRVYQGHTAGLWSVARHGNTLYTAANDATVRRWSLATPGQWIWETGQPAISAAIAPDGRMVAVGLESGGLRLYSVPQGQVLGGVDDAHGSSAINRIAFNADGNLLATGGMDSKAKLWRVDGTPDKVKLTLVHTFKDHSDAVYAFAFSPDGRTLATAGYDGKIGLFDVASGKGRLFEAHEGKVASIAFNPEGDRLLSAGITDFRLRLWDLADPTRPPRELARAQDRLMWAVLRPDGRDVAAVGRGASKVSLYDLASTPGAPRRLVGHEQTVYRAIYSPDGRQLATVSSDMTVRLWDLESERLLFTLRLPTEFQHPSPLWDFDFRCTAAGECWIAVPLTVGRLALYRLPYKE